jgi:hypothetical protein
MNSDKRFYILMHFFVVLGTVGFVLLLWTSIRHDDWSSTTYSGIAFLISVAALIMTTLQSVSIARQVRVTQRAAQLVKETSRELAILVNEDKKMEREIEQDIALDREIIAALEEHGVGHNESERKAVAATIQKRLKK